MNYTIVKNGPVVFIKNILIMEFFAGILLFLASFVENYEMLFMNLGFDSYFRYEIFILIVSFLFQLFYITTLFINWYFSFYEIRDKEIIKKSGILFRRKKIYRAEDVLSIETSESILDRITKHGTIILNLKNDKTIKIENVANFNEYVHIIKRILGQILEGKDCKNTEEIIKKGESINLEFKETLRFDTRNKNVNKDLEKAVLKTIVGFLNSNGGSLIIGVDNLGNIKGLQDDYTYLPQKNKDGFENHLTSLIKTMIGIPFTKYINVNFEEIKGKEICIVNVKNSLKPAFLKNSDNKEEFFIRAGNSTQPLKMSEAQEYIENHFKN